MDAPVLALADALANTGIPAAAAFAPCGPGRSVAGLGVILPRLTVRASGAGSIISFGSGPEQFVVCSGRGDADEQSDNETK